MSRGYSVEQWAQWIDEQQASGLSIAAFCESIGVSQNAFYVRRRQLARRQPAAAAGFVSLRLAAEETIAQVRDPRNHAAIEIEVPGGTVVRVNDPHVVRDVVTVILEHGARR